MTYLYPRTCAVWDLDSGKIIWEAANLQPEPLNGLVTPDEDHVMTVHTDGTVRLWNIYMETDGVNNGEISSVATGVTYCPANKGTVHAIHT